MTYKWKVPVYKVSAQEAGEHIEELEKQNGKVTPQILLDDSRPEDAILHHCYEWDDTVAAEKYRLEQSKNIIGNLVVAHISDAIGQPKEPVRAFVSIKNRNEKAEYVNIVTALSDDEMRLQAEMNAVKELKMFKAKYNGLLDVVKLLKDFAAGMVA